MFYLISKMRAEVFSSDKIFNVDESGINMALRKGKVVVRKGARSAYTHEKGSKDHITVNCCLNAYP